MADSATAADLPEPTITVTLTNGWRIRLARVEATRMGYIRLTWPDGGQRYLAAHRVRSISDSSETDLTEYVLRDHKSIGDAPKVKAAPRSKPSEPCLTPRPLPDCKTCLVNQAGAVVLLGQESTPGDYYVVVDLGAVRNTSPRFGIGGDLYFAANGSVSRFGLKARLRYWASQRLAIDFAPGILVAGADGWRGETLYPGLIVEADVTLRGWFTVTGGFESIRAAKTYSFAFGSYSTIETTDETWYAGAKLGGGPGLGAGLVGLATILVMASGI